MNPENLNKTGEKRRAAPETVKPLPRSIIRRMPFELLDGEWRFALDVANEGIHRHWYVQHDYTETAFFPGSIESHLDAVKHIKDESPLYKKSDEVIAWY